MWLITKFGFFSVVEKPHDRKAATLTIRARVLSDLESLRIYLPYLGKIEMSRESDYAFRARVKKSYFAAALKKIALDIDYSNFKDKVTEVQGKARAKCYTEVWSTLYSLQRTE